MKKLCLYALILSLLGAGCIYVALSYKSWQGRRPNDQPNTSWVSEDGTIHLYVDENHRGRGTLLRDGEEIPFIFSSDSGVCLYFYTPEGENLPGYGPNSDYTIGIWECKYPRGDHFTATVVQTTYFEVGQKLSFYRVDE